MEYRIYVSYLVNYECLGTHNAKRTIKILDKVMKDDRFKIVDVIEVNREENYEFPVFVYNGFNMEEYVEFRNTLIEDNKIKKYTKKI